MPRPVLRYTIVVGATILASLCLAAYGFAQKSSHAGGKSAALKQGLTIAFLPKQINNEYFTVAFAGSQQAAKVLGDTVTEVGPSQATASAQVPYIGTLTQQQVSVIAISADDPNAVAPALKQAMAAGVKVISYDSDVAPDARSLYVEDVDFPTLATTLINQIGKGIHFRGQFSIITGSPTAGNVEAAIALIKTDLKAPKYRNMQLVKIEYANDDDQLSFQDTQSLVQAYPHLKAIMGLSSVGFAAAARYLDSSPEKGKVALTGLGTPNIMRKYIKDGTVASSVLWDVNKLGYLATYASAALASGEITGAVGEHFNAGVLGTKTIIAGNTVLLGPPTVFTKTNVGKYHF